MNGEETGAPGAESLIDLIGALSEPPAPAPIPLTPDTWGWAALAVLVVVLLAMIALRRAAHRRANAYRRAALAELADARTATEVAAILRRAALAAWPREDVAGLTGAAWTAFLERSGKGGFPAEAGAELREAPYRTEMAPPSPALRRAAEDWLRTHHAGAAPASTGPNEAVA